jgi:hypothetical protein
MVFSSNVIETQEQRPSVLLPSAIGNRSSVFNRNLKQNVSVHLPWWILVKCIRTLSFHKDSAKICKKGNYNLSINEIKQEVINIVDRA